MKLLILRRSCLLVEFNVTAHFDHPTPAPLRRVMERTIVTVCGSLFLTILPCMVVKSAFYVTVSACALSYLPLICPRFRLNAPMSSTTRVKADLTFLRLQQGAYQLQL